MTKRDGKKKWQKMTKKKQIYENDKKGREKEMAK